VGDFCMCREVQLHTSRHCAACYLDLRIFMGAQLAKVVLTAARDQLCDQSAKHTGCPATILHVFTQVVEHCSCLS
jgi:hypothetical protein